MAEATETNLIHPSAHQPQGARILLLEDDELVRESVARTLTCAGHDAVALADPREALQRLAACGFDLLLAAVTVPGMTWTELLTEAKTLRPELPVVVMAPYAGLRLAVEAMRRGAYDYIQKPFEKDELLLLVERTVEHARLRRENEALRVEDASADGTERPGPVLIGSSGAMQGLRRAIEQNARSDATVLVRGESGTGKQLVARLIHAASDRRDRPMLRLNCAAFSEPLLACELFGQEMSPSAGPRATRRGRLELADGGTLLLDEVGVLTPPIQSRLVRFLQEQAFERPGSTAMQHANVRLVCTAERSLEEAIEQGGFQSDLYRRLSTVALEVPSLRQRREDIPELVRHFLHRIARREGQAFRHIEPEALRLLQRYSWPGNVRELQNVIERAVLLEREPGVLQAATMAPWLGEHRPNPASADPLDQLPLAEVEKRVILDTLAKFEGHRARTATALGIGVRTLGIKLKKWRQDGELAIGVGATSSDSGRIARFTAVAQAAGPGMARG